MNKGCVQPLASYNLSCKMARLPLLTLLFASTSTCHWWLSASFPLHTNSRWIVDDAGLRVKLACISWTAHLEPMLAEGLSKQPLDRISKLIGSMGFNCVRLTWPLFMVTDSTFSSLTVQQSFESLGLNESLAGIKVNNPAMVDISLTQAFQVNFLKYFLLSYCHLWRLWAASLVPNYPSLIYKDSSNIKLNFTEMIFFMTGMMITSILRSWWEKIPLQPVETSFSICSKQALFPSCGKVASCNHKIWTPMCNMVQIDLHL